jgi:chromosome segregation ATPase
MADEKLSPVDQAIDNAVAAVDAAAGSKADALRAQLADVTSQRKALAAQENDLKAQIAAIEGPEAKKAEAFAKFAEIIKSGKPHPALRQFGL